MKKTIRISGKCFRNLGNIAITGILMLMIFPSFAAPFAYVGEAFSNSIRVIDTATNIETATIATSSYSKVVTHPSGGFIYIPVNLGPWSLGSLDVYGTSNNSLLATIPVGVAPIDVAVHPDGDFVYVVSKSGQVPSGSGPGIISVVDTSTNTVSATIGLAQNITHSATHLEVHPTGNVLYVGVSSTGTITTFDTNTFQFVATINLGFSFDDLAIHPSGGYLYATRGATLKVIDTTTNSVVDSISINGYGYSIAVHPDGNTVYVANYTNNTVSVVDTTTNTMTASVSTSFPFSLAVHPGGDFVYVTGFTASGPDGFVSIIDSASNQIIDTISVAASESSTIGLPLSITIGPLLEPVGGIATGISAVSVTCTNSTSGQSVSIGLGSEKTWDCESNGLQVNTGDSIEMVVTGNAN